MRKKCITLVQLLGETVGRNDQMRSTTGIYLNRYSAG